MTQSIIIGRPQFPNRYKVIYGNIDKGVKPDGTEYAHVMNITDVQHLPESLVDLLPPRVVRLSQTATEFLVVDNFNGKITYS